MKAITLWQPWASLIAVGVKRLETRSWYTGHRGPIAIHAAAKSPKIDSLMDAEQALEFIKLVYQYCGCAPGELPHGAVIATAELIECYKVFAHHSGGVIDLRGNKCEMTVLSASDEYKFGDFSLGRYAWRFMHPLPLAEPIPAKGKQGLWNWEEGAK